MRFVAENNGQTLYAEEQPGGTTCFTAVYADLAVAPVCVSCHNGHTHSPKRDVELGGVVGGVAIRIPPDS